MHPIDLHKSRDITGSWPAMTIDVWNTDISDIRDIYDIRDIRDICDIRDIRNIRVIRVITDICITHRSIVRIFL